MNKLFTRKQLRRAAFILLVAAGFIAGRMYRPADAKKTTTVPAAEAITQLRTIPLSDSTSDVIAYEYHCRKGDYGVTYTCAAIIRHIDPATDDYRTYCRLVVRDIINSLGTDNISVTVYDSYEAYTMGEGTAATLEEQAMAATDTVYKHIVAMYDGSTHSFSDGDSHTFSYYSLAGNKYTEQLAWE